MSDGQIIALIILIAFFLSLGLPLIFIFFHEIVDFCEDTLDFLVSAIKAPIEKYKRSKQMNCIHLWRKLDGDYSRSETIYRYRCRKCKDEKRLNENQSEKFEMDFMSDWDEVRE